MMLIDPPSPFAPEQEWRDFLAEMHAAKAEGQDVRDHIKLAEETLKQKAAGTLSSAP